MNVVKVMKKVLVVKYPSDTHPSTQERIAAAKRIIDLQSTTAAN